MNLPGTRHLRWSRSLRLCAILALSAGVLLHADDKKKPSAPPKAPAKSAPKSGAPGGAGTHGSAAGGASHGPTTAGHGPTTTTSGHTTAATSGRATTGSTAGTHGSVTPTRTGASSVPKGATVSTTKSGGTVTKRPDGKVASLHDPKRGMDVHRGLNGNRTVVVEHSDHSRVVVEHGGHGYVQRPYTFHGHEYASRSYYYHGAYYNRYYGRYYYRGLYINPYYPAFYYGPAYYGWVYNPWAAPVVYAGWGWAGTPWFGFYGAYFTPYPVYASPALWLTDYMISASLAADYQARAEAQNQAAALSAPAPLSPETKDLIAEEVRRQVALENAEAQKGVQSEPDSASSSIQRALTDGVAHVFVAGSDLDLVDAGGAECAVSQGDALQLTGQNAPDATSVNLTVLASKGGKECPKGDTVAVSLQDLQDMQNHMRETIDQGMQDLQKKQGQGGLPAAPASAQAPPVQSAMAAAAPPPPPEKEVAAQLTEQSKGADAAEAEAVADTPGTAPAVAASTAAPATVGLGQSFDQVTGALGQPKTIMDLGAKKIYVYPDMKVTFNDGKVTDIK
jgi:hypothetical protein